METFILQLRLLRIFANTTFLHNDCLLVDYTIAIRSTSDSTNPSNFCQKLDTGVPNSDWAGLERLILSVPAEVIETGHKTI
jgi:hypothetical protein